jgi:hypothetical protein
LVLSLWITIAARLTVIEALALPEPALVDVKVAVLSY